MKSPAYHFYLYLYLTLGRVSCTEYMLKTWWVLIFWSSFYALKSLHIKSPKEAELWHLGQWWQKINWKLKGRMSIYLPSGRHCLILEDSDKLLGYGWEPGIWIQLLFSILCPAEVRISFVCCNMRTQIITSLFLDILRTDLKFTLEY